MMNEWQKKVWSALIPHVGKHNAISQAEIEAVTGLHRRKVRAVIKSLVEDCHLRICSRYTKDGGYFIAQNREEAHEASVKIRHHALSMLRRANVYEKLNFSIIQRELDL